MAHLEDLTIGSVVTGLLPNEPITVVSTKWYGSNCIEVIYKTNTGVTGSQVLYRDDEASPRIYRNMLAFIAPDSNMIGSLREAVKMYLAWVSIQQDSEDLNLDAAQVRETANSVMRCDQTINVRILETYCHLLVPYIDREIDLKTVIWDVISIRGSTDPIVTKAAHKMQQNEQLITQWAPALLLMQLDGLLWRDTNDINVGELWKMLCTYCYLPRLANYDVLAQAIQNGVNSKEYFAYAEGKTENRYFGLKYDQFAGFIDRSGYIVKLITALRQMAEEPIQPPSIIDPPGHDPVNPPPPGTDPISPPPPIKPANTRFSMATTLDSTRVIKNISELMDEVINHLTALNGASVEIKLIVDASIPEGTPQSTVRTITENCRTLKVEDFGFED